MTVLAERVIVESLRAGTPTSWVVRGSSMWPAIRDGATVRVTPGDVSSLRAGEVVAFARGGAVVVHRVLAVSAHGVVCRGDALARADGFVAWADVLGRAAVLTQRGLTPRWPAAGELRAIMRALMGVARAGWA